MCLKDHSCHALIFLLGCEGLLDPGVGVKREAVLSTRRNAPHEHREAHARREARPASPGVHLTGGGERERLCAADVHVRDQQAVALQLQQPARPAVREGAAVIRVNAQVQNLRREVLAVHECFTAGKFRVHFLLSSPDNRHW